MKSTALDPCSASLPLFEALQQARSHLDHATAALEDTLQEAAASRRLYEEAVNGAPDGILIVEKGSGRIRQANPAMTAATGYSMSQLESMNLAELFAEQERDKIPRFLDDGGGQGAVAPSGMVIRRADGSELSVGAAARALTGSEPECLAVFVRDVSDQVSDREHWREEKAVLEQQVVERTEQTNQANVRLEEARLQAQLLEREAKQATRAKDQFFAAMSSELRTPLNAVIGMSELLLDMEMGREQQHTADAIAASAKTLLNLINDILDYSNIEAGKLALETSAFYLPELLAGVVDTFSLQARQKGLDLELDLRPEVPEYLVGDPVRLRQVLVNLLGNAVRYTDTGGVKVRVAYERDPAGQVELRVKVQDTGPGVPQERQTQIFEAFARPQGAEGGNRGGCGLGLHISLQLVEMMSGTMGLESKPGQGSTFWFTAQFTRPTADQIRELESRVKAIPSEGPGGIPRDLRILLVEDNPVNQRVALGMLNNLGLEGRSADDGPQALDLLTHEKFDLVFMDIIIPEMSGLEVTRRVRSEEAGDLNVLTPIIAMTAHATRQDRQLCLDAGMNGYLAKPVSTEKLRDTILRALADGSGDTPAPAVDDFALDHAVSALDGGAAHTEPAAAEFITDSRRRLKVIIGALQNYDFNFAAREMQIIEDGAQCLKAEGISALTGDLLRSIKAKQQEHALEVADEIRDALNGLEVRV